MRDIANYTQKYLDKDYSDFESYMVKFRRNQVLKFLSDYQAKNILEIGCGMDSIAKFYNDYEKFVIVEPSGVFAQKAREDLAQKSNVKIIQDFIQNQVSYLKDNQFDCIVLSSLLHEVENPKELLASLIPLCSPPTTLHINVPNSQSFHLLWAYESEIIPQLGGLSATAKSLQQHTSFCMESLCALVEEVGLEILDKGSYFLKPFNHAKMSLALQDGILDENLLQGLEKMTKYTPNLGAEIFVNVRVRVGL